MPNDRIENRCFLQSPEWAALQRSLGKEVFSISSGGLEGNAILSPLPLGFSYLYAPRGPVGGLSAESLRAFASAARSHADARTLFLRVEPYEDERLELARSLRASGFFPTPSVQPKETRVLDLAASEEDLLRAMEHDTRYAIRAAEKRGVAVRETTAADDPGAFETFWALFRMTNERHGLRAFSRTYYERVAALGGACPARIFVASREERDIAAAIAVSYGGTTTYLYAASDREYAKYNAPSLLLWEMVRAARRAGDRTFDFWGVSRENKKWAGVSAFKKSFGGREVRYAGTWDMPFRPFAYRAYRFAKKILK